MSTNDPRQSRKQKQKELRLNPTSNGTERLKTVVRRLPPNLPEEIFWQSVQAWVTDDTVTWRSYYPGKLRTKRVNKESIPSRAYIAFKNEDYVATFSREYDGHLFRDKAGNESCAVVEFAPFQKVPAEKKKADARNNTIDNDEDYLSFLEVLKNTAKTESVSLETLIAASQPRPPPTTTPLLEALKAEKSAQKDKEAILRNHAHYKDAAASAASLKKEEVKKKAAAAAAQAAKQPEPSAPLSKKAKKAAAAAATQKASPAQDGQGALGKSLPAGAGAGGTPSSAKPPTPASTAGHALRSRHPKEPHGRSQLAKGDISATVPTIASVSGHGLTLPPPATTENASPSEPVPVQGQGQRKNRPVVGLGRQLEAALNGAGVAVVPGNPGGDRKRRDKGGEPVSGPGPGTEGGGKGGKHQHWEEQVSGNVPVAIVPSILQRPEAGGDGGTAPDVVIVQRPPSSRGTEGSGGYGEGVGAALGGAGAARGGLRRGRGRGKGGPRGG